MSIKAKSESDNFALVYGKALSLYKLRPRSESEFRRRLKHYARKAGAPSAFSLAEEVVEQLRNEEIVNDHKFCQWWIEQRSEFNPRGKRLLLAELKAKGVNEGIINEAIAQSQQEEVDIFGVKKVALDEKTLAKMAAKKKQKIYQTDDKFTFTKRMVRYLLRRGFDYNTADEATQELITKYYE